MDRRSYLLGTSLATVTAVVTALAGSGMGGTGTPPLGVELTDVRESAVGEIGVTATVWNASNRRVTEPVELILGAGTVVDTRQVTLAAGERVTTALEGDRPAAVEGSVRVRVVAGQATAETTVEGAAADRPVDARTLLRRYFEGYAAGVTDGAGEIDEDAQIPSDVATALQATFDDPHAAAERGRTDGRDAVRECPVGGYPPGLVDVVSERGDDFRVSFDSCDRAVVTGQFEAGDTIAASTTWEDEAGVGNTLLEDRIAIGDDVAAPFDGMIVFEVGAEPGVTETAVGAHVTVSAYGGAGTVITGISDPSGYVTASITHPNPRSEACLEELADSE
jgi:hypothetical protein